MSTIDSTTRHNPAGNDHAGHDHAGHNRGGDRCDRHRYRTRRVRAGHLTVTVDLHGVGGPPIDIEIARTSLNAPAECTDHIGVVGFCMGRGFALCTANKGFGAAAPNYRTLPGDELDTMTLLRAKGFSVVVSRTRASSVVRLVASDVSNDVLTENGALDDVAARDVCANLAKAAILVGIYFDSGTTPENAGSVTAYDPARPFSHKSLRLADLVQRDVLGAMNARGWAIPDAGVLSDTGLGSVVPTAPGTGGPLAADAARYGHLLLLGPAMSGYFATPSEMPGAVVEPLFITDPFEASIAASTKGQQVIAAGIAQGIEQYFAVA